MSGIFFRLSQTREVWGFFFSFYYILINTSFGVASDFVTFWFNVGFNSDSPDTFHFFLLYKIVGSFLIEKNLYKLKVLVFPKLNKEKVAFSEVKYFSVTLRKILPNFFLLENLLANHGKSYLFHFVMIIKTVWKPCFGKWCTAAPWFFKHSHAMGARRQFRTWCCISPFEVLHLSLPYCFLLSFELLCMLGPVTSL